MAAVPDGAGGGSGAEGAARAALRAGGRPAPSARPGAAAGASGFLSVRGKRERESGARGRDGAVVTAVR